jgi:hypothetical protein
MRSVGYKVAVGKGGGVVDLDALEEVAGLVVCQ